MRACSVGRRRLQDVFTNFWSLLPSYQLQSNKKINVRIILNNSCSFRKIDQFRFPTQTSRTQVGSTQLLSSTIYLSSAQWRWLLTLDPTSRLSCWLTHPCHRISSSPQKGGQFVNLWVEFLRALIIIGYFCFILHHWCWKSKDLKAHSWLCSLCLRNRKIIKSLWLETLALFILSVRFLSNLSHQGQSEPSFFSSPVASCHQVGAASSSPKLITLKLAWLYWPDYLHQQRPIDWHC